MARSAFRSSRRARPGKGRCAPLLRIGAPRPDGRSASLTWSARGAGGGAPSHATRGRKEDHDVTYLHNHHRRFARPAAHCFADRKSRSRLGSATAPMRKQHRVERLGGQRLARRHPSRALSECSWLSTRDRGVPRCRTRARIYRGDRPRDTCEARPRSSDAVSGRRLERPRGRRRQRRRPRQRQRPAAAAATRQRQRPRADRTSSGQFGCREPSGRARRRRIPARSRDPRCATKGRESRAMW
jgi:hypothetical protein